MRHVGMILWRFVIYAPLLIGLAYVGDQSHQGAASAIALGCIAIAAIEARFSREVPKIKLYGEGAQQSLILPKVVSYSYLALLLVLALSLQGEYVKRLDKVTFFINDVFPVIGRIRNNQSDFFRGNAISIIVTFKVGALLFIPVFVFSVWRPIKNVARGAFSITYDNWRSLIVPSLAFYVCMLFLYDFLSGNAGYLFHGHQSLLNSYFLPVCVAVLFWLLSSDFLFPRQIAATYELLRVLMSKSNIGEGGQ